MLAAQRHVEHWLERNTSMKGDYAEAMQQSGYLTDLNTYISVAHWAYQQGIEYGAHGWVEKKLTEAIDSSCLSLLS